MPYVKKDIRETYKELLPNLQKKIFSVGELNYVITMLAQGFVQKTGRDYTNINAVIGAMEAAKLEFYRRLAAPYEDEKIAQNGDVYQ